MAITDLPFVIVLLFIIAIMILVGTRLWTDIKPELQKEVGTQANQTLETAGLAFGVFDSVFLFVTVGLGMAVILMAYLIDTHPAFFFLTLIVFIIFTLITPQLANIVKDFAGATELTAQYPIMSWVWQNMPMFYLVIGMMTLIVMYAKLRGGTEGGV